jgi:6-pyruvoyltetrahydropterin/6-carboxytetrahydropterin synthase
MTTLTTIELYKESMHFSAAHFTIFSATERERLHGHNYRVQVDLTTVVQDNGMASDYAVFKKKINFLCQQLDEYCLLPTQSPYLNISEQDDHYVVYFNRKKMSLLKEDVRLLSLRNVTIEDLSLWFLRELVKDTDLLREHLIHGIVIKVFSGPGQCASATWANGHGRVD